MGIYPASKASVEGKAPSGFAGGGGDASPWKKKLTELLHSCNIDVMLIEEYRGNKKEESE